MNKGQIEMLLKFWAVAADVCTEHGWLEAAAHFNGLIDALLLEIAMAISKLPVDDDGKGSIH